MKQVQIGKIYFNDEDGRFYQPIADHCHTFETRSWRQDDDGKIYGYDRVYIPEEDFEKMVDTRTVYDLHITGTNQDGDETEIDCFRFDEKRLAVEEKAKVYRSDFYAGIENLYAYIKEVTVA